MTTDFSSDGSMWTQLNDDSYTNDPVLDGGRLHWRKHRGCGANTLDSRTAP